MGTSWSSPMLRDRPRQYCTFWLKDQCFGVEILDLKEIYSEMEVTRIFHAHPAVLGYVNIRGKIHLIIDLARILRIGVERTTDRPAGGSRLLIFKPSVAEPFGIVIDRVGDIVAADESTIELSPAADEDHGPGARLSRENSILSGICKMPDFLFTIVNPRRLIAFLSEAHDRPGQTKPVHPG